MALGGGSWQAQDKILPGSYINFSSLAKATATLSERGYAAAPFELSWGPEGEVFSITSKQFQRDAQAYFGYSYDHPKLLALREMFRHATTVYCYRLGAGAKASCTYGEAAYPGVRGNDISIVISNSVDQPSLWEVGTYLDGEQMDLQTVAEAAQLVDNAWVVFKREGVTLEGTAGIRLTGGADAAEIDGGSHQAFLDKLEAYSFNALCCPSADPSVVALYTQYTARMRDEVGSKFQLVAWQPEADYEGVIGVWNKASHASIDKVDPQMTVYWVTGAQAGVSVQSSLTNAKYDGELNLDTDYTQAELEDALLAGKFMFHNVNGETRVLEDINTLVTLTETKGELFQSDQTVRVCDQIANDVAVLFRTRYAGVVPNDASGRASLWGDIVKLLRALETLRAIEDFDPGCVVCELGEKKKAVLCTISGLNIVNAMSQLYMSVVIQ